MQASIATCNAGLYGSEQRAAHHCRLCDAPRPHNRLATWCWIASGKVWRAVQIFLTVTGAAWLAALPGAILTAYLCDDTARAKVFFALDLATFVAGQAALTTMYNPSTRFNKGFPFHELDAASLGMVRKRGAVSYTHLTLPTKA